MKRKNCNAIATLVWCLILFTCSAFPCGAPQQLFGVVHDGLMPIPGAVVVIDNQPFRSGFGFYSVMMGACPESHTITVRHWRYSFEPVTFWTDGSGRRININFTPTESKIGR